MTRTSSRRDPGGQAGTSPGREVPDRVVRTVCSPNCSGTCGINAFVKDDRIIKIEPAAFPEPGFERICIKGIAMAMQRIHHPDRLTHPLLRTGERGAGQWRKISWEEAFAYLADRLDGIRREHGARANAWMTMSGNYGFKATTAPERIANCLGGTTFTHGGMMGDLSCAMGYLPTLGVGSTANDLADLPKASHVFIFGRNPADTDHSEMRFLFDAMEAGVRLTVIDPRFSRTAAKADSWVAPRPGTDAALVLGMISHIIERKLLDTGFILAHTNAPFLVNVASGALVRGGELGWRDPAGYVVWQDGPRPAGEAGTPLLRGEFELQAADGGVRICRPAFEFMLAAWSAYSVEQAAQICELEPAQIRALADDYAGAERPWLWAGAGPQRYHHGHLAHRAYVTLGALCGNIGKPYAGVNCLDGAHMRLSFNPPREWTNPGGKSGHSQPGVHMQEIIRTGEPWPIKSLWLSSYGFATQSPNFRRFVADSLPQLDLFVVTEQMMTPAAQYADIVLPCVSYYEEELDLVAGGEHWYLQLRQRAISPVGESRNDYEIFKGVCEAMGEGDDWQMSNEEVCRFVLEHHVDPAINGIDWDTLRRELVAEVRLPRPYVPLGDLHFPTPSGRIELYTEGLREHGEAVAIFREPLEGNRSELASRYPLTLLSHKHVHSAHSTHMMLPWIREMVPEPLLDIHPEDAAARGLADGDWAQVCNDRGAFELRVSVTPGIKRGTVSVPQGFWQGSFRKGHHAELGHIVTNAVQEAVIETNYPVWDIAVQVSRA